MKTGDRREFLKKVPKKKKGLGAGEGKGHSIISQRGKDHRIG